MYCDGVGTRSSRRRWYTLAVIALLVAAVVVVQVLILPPREGMMVGRTTTIDETRVSGYDGWNNVNDHFWGVASRTRKLEARTGTSVGQHRRARGASSDEAVEGRGEADQGQSRLTAAIDGGAHQFEGAGGQFGLSSDWRIAIQEGGDLRGEACMATEKRKAMLEILEKRKMTPSRKKVAICLRTKDYARYLPEWIAFHYTTGVDEITIYDDDSVDNTTEVIKPFVDAGIVRYIFEPIPTLSKEMKPLNECLAHYIEEKEKAGSNAPSWVLFHDTDEYLFPEDTSLTILDALEKHNDTCCALVPRVQYGTSGYEEMPRGLMTEVFLSHQLKRSPHFLPKVMVNLDPTAKGNPVLPPLKSMHNAEGCKCADHERSNMRINHYLGCRGDYVDRLDRYWTNVLKGSKTVSNRLERRDQNNCRSHAVTHWACATREILYRAEEGLDFETGLERKDF